MTTGPEKECPLEKNWIIHNRDAGTTSLIRFVKRNEDGNFIIAISRAFQSVDDMYFNRKEGRKYSLERMDTYLYDARRRFFKTSKAKRKPIMHEIHVRRDKNSRHHTKVIEFALGEENLMNDREMEVWHSIILPQIEARLQFLEDVK